MNDPIDLEHPEAEELRAQARAERRYFRQLHRHPDPRDPEHPEPPQSEISDFIRYGGLA